MNKTIVTEQVFKAFVKVQRSGEAKSGKISILDYDSTNRLSGGVVKKDEHLEIINNYDKYAGRYPDVR